MNRNPFKKVFALEDGLEYFNLFSKQSQFVEKLYTSGYFGEKLQPLALNTYHALSIDQALLMYRRYKVYSPDPRSIVATDVRPS